MKQYITMNKIHKYDMYQFLGIMDHRFASISQLFDPFIFRGQLINWFYDEKRTSYGNEWFEINKEHGLIALYHTADRMSDETIFDLDSLQRFEMSRKNFAEIIYQWDELRVSRPDTILLVIHEENHVSLEIDPIIIKEYQDAGYAFDINKESQGMKEYTCFDKGVFDKYLSYSGLKSVYSQLNCVQELISETWFPKRERRFVFSIYKYYDEKNDMFHIGYYDELQGRLNPIQFKPAFSELGKYIKSDNSCKITTQNFTELTMKWLAIEELAAPFAIIYRAQDDWIHCQAFQKEKEMEQFMIDYHAL